jgi:UPF0755 protein
MSKTKAKKSMAGIIILLCILLIIGGGIVFAVVKYKQFTSYTVNSAKQHGDEQKTIELTIENGSSVRDIASLLQNSGVIDNNMQFIYLCKKNGKGDNFQPGEHTFNNYMDFNAVCTELESGGLSEEQVTVTITEGMWLKEIAALMEEKGLCTADEFIEACNSRDYDYDFVADIPDRDNLLEGYLFPDTYNFSTDMTAHDIVNKMLSRFNDVFDVSLKGAASMHNLSVDEAVIMASLIESEAKYPEDRAKISSVMYNRIEQGMKLQMDASVLYALGERKSRVLYADLEVADEHNTYYVSGLPVGPIGNAGAACLEAAVNPADTDYIYYVVENQETGEHYFTNNYNDFLTASENYKSTLE